MAGARTVPETFNRQDWPRLVAAASKDCQVRLSALEASIGSGSFTLDDGTASASGVFSFDDGGA